MLGQNAGAGRITINKSKDISDTSIVTANFIIHHQSLLNYFLYLYNNKYSIGCQALFNDLMLHQILLHYQQSYYFYSMTYLGHYNIEYTNKVLIYSKGP